MKKPKTYKQQDGCWNCTGVDRCAVASSAYPICTAYHKRFFVMNWAICNRWKFDDIKHSKNRFGF